MKIKRFEAQTVQEAIKQIKETLGPDAVILSIKEIKRGKGILGFLHKGVEVTAAIDMPVEHSESPVEEKFEKIESFSNLVRVMEELKLEIKELKDYIQTFMPSPTEASTEIFNLCQQMRMNGLAAEIALKLIEGFKEGFLDTIDENMNIQEFLSYLLSSLVKILPPLEDIKDEQKIAVFVGPTGTGKTTTLAKIAGNLVKVGKNVGIITLDPRKFALEQLNFYANNWGIPIEKVKSPKGLIRAIRRYVEKDVIFIDTCGCSPNNEFQIKDLGRYLHQLSKPLLIYLVLSVTTKEEILLKTAKQFDFLSISSLLFTKLDEGDAHGTIFNQMVYTGKPLSYLTTGQRVPEDIEIATPERVIDLVINNLRGDSDVERNAQIS